MCILVTKDDTVGVSRGGKMQSRIYNLTYFSGTFGTFRTSNPGSITGRKGTKTVKAVRKGKNTQGEQLLTNSETGLRGLGAPSFGHISAKGVTWTAC